MIPQRRANIPPGAVESIMSKGKSSSHAHAQRSNVHNPNNPAHHAAQVNRGNQMNPKHPAHPANAEQAAGNKTEGGQK